MHKVSTDGTCLTTLDMKQRVMRFLTENGKQMEFSTTDENNTDNLMVGEHNIRISYHQIGIIK